MINKVNKWLLLSMFFMVNSCMKEAQIADKDYPFLITNQISEITGTSVVFNGEIVSTGNEEVIEYGFLWDSEFPVIETANKIAINTPADIGSFRAIIDYNLYKDSVQWVRTYLKTNNYIVYGNKIKFTSNGGIPAEITGISPMKGYVNSRVIIQGKNFGNQKDKVSVFFGDFEAKIDSLDDKMLIVSVPQISQDVAVPVKVSVYNKPTISVDKFEAFTYWKRISDFPGGQRFGATSFSIDDRGYVGLGAKSYDNFSSFYTYDPQNNTWTRIADFPGGERRYAIGFSYKGKGYVGFGYADDHYFTDLWSYDPNTDVWTKVAENEYINTYGNAYFLIGEELFIVRSGVYKLNLENLEFSYLDNFPGDYRFYSVGFSLNDKGYMFAGQKSGNGKLRDLWEYDSNQNTWDMLSELPGNEYRDAPIGFALSERLFMGMGRFSRAYNDIFEYDLFSNEWYKLENIPGGGRAHAVSFTIGDKAYIGTGRDMHLYTFSDFYEFDPNKK